MSIEITTATPAEKAGIRGALGFIVNNLPENPRIMGLGDSITKSNSAGGSPSDIYKVIHGSSFIAQAAIRLGCLLVGNAGIAGETTATIVSRISTDVLPLKPHIVVFTSGTNDYSNTTSTAKSLSEVLELQKSACELLIENGILPVLGAVPPRATTTVRWKDGLTVAQATAMGRDLLWDYAQKRGLPWVPFDATMRTKSTTYEGFGLEVLPGGTASFSVDGIHPTNPTGEYHMGLALNAALRKIIPASDYRSRWLFRQQVDDFRSLIGSGRGWFADGGGGVATGWGLLGTSTMAGHTMQILTAADNRRLWQWTIPETSVGTLGYLFSNISPDQVAPRGFAAGDRILVAVRIQTQNCRWDSLNSVSISAYVNHNSSGGRSAGAFGMVIGDLEDGLLLWEFTVPPTSNQLTLHLQVTAGASRVGLGNSIVRWGEPSMWNLTRLGIDPLT